MFIVENEQSSILKSGQPGDHSAVLFRSSRWQQFELVLLAKFVMLFP